MTGLGQDEASGMAMTIQLPEFQSSASSLELTAADHEAIRYFRTTFARVHHTKNPDFSVYSIMFTIAEREALVMQAVLALGGRDIESRRPESKSSGQLVRQQRWGYLRHYSAALRRLADSLLTGPHGQSLPDLDVSCTALYLMLLYEQKYGDAECHGLSNHLRGAAMIFRQWGQTISEQLDAPQLGNLPVLSRNADSGHLSLYSARIIIWISLCDATAASYGIGGPVNVALREILAYPGKHPVAEDVERLHTFSNSLFRTMWAQSYPQVELLDDIENRSVYELMVCSSQARYALAELAQAKDDNRQYFLDAAMSTTKYMTTKYSELLEVASELSPSTDSSHRLVANLRSVAPHYHAVIVLLAQLAGNDAFIYGGVDVAAHIASVLKFARQILRHENDEAVMRIAWPLFVVALRTNSRHERDWILARFQAMSRLGQNMKRAWEFLVSHTKGKNTENPWLDPRAWFRSSDHSLFVV